MANKSNHALHAALTNEMLAAILLQILHHSDSPDLINEATSPNMDPERLHALLVNHNELRHAQLKNGHRVAPAAAAPAAPRRGSVLSQPGINTAVTNLLRPRG